MRRFYCESLCMNKLLKALGRKDSSQRVVFILGGTRYGFISGYIQADAHTDATLDHTGSRVTVRPGLPPLRRAYSVQPPHAHTTLYGPKPSNAASTSAHLCAVA